MASSGDYLSTVSRQQLIRISAIPAYSSTLTLIGDLRHGKQPEFRVSKDDFVIRDNRSKAFRMIGNAVPPPMAARLAGFIRDAILVGQE